MKDLHIGRTFVYQMDEAITAEIISEYADASGDKNAIHLDDHAAKEAGFSKPVVHGMWSCGLAVSAVQQWFGVGIFIHYLETSFINPLLQGDQLTITGEIVRVTFDDFSVKIGGVNQAEQVIFRGEFRLKEGLHE
ncbi:MaoC family dehydratase [Halobacillus rhizosphaerae]|uniref:MaoC family dehydratase n=1 Tax=Halobacillus rhizosphaerae TaxID=3064889 RepID=UPI00398A6F3B